MSASRRRRLAQLETGIAVLTGALAVLTIFWRDWIEGLTGWDPDHHSGSAEVGIIVGLAVVSVMFGLLARQSRRHLQTASEAR